MSNWYETRLAQPVFLYEPNNRQYSYAERVSSLAVSRKCLTVFLLLSVTLALFLFNLSLELPKWELEEVLAPLFGIRPIHNQTQDGKEAISPFLTYQKIVWISLASVVAAVLLALSGNISQSLLQNPLADCSTLGMIDAAAFGLMLLKVFLGASIGSFYWAYFLSAFFFAFLIFMLILFIFNKNSSWERKNSCTMIILFGLILNIFFRAVTHLIKQVSTVSVSTSFALALGGAENIYELFPYQFPLLRYAIPITLLLFVVVRSLSKSWNLAELGFDQAHSLGVNIRLLQVVGYFIILCCNTLTINLVGNISFAGLISTHIARKLFRTRKYETIIPSSSLISICLLMVAVTINRLIPSISSSNLILGIGAVSLFFLTRS